MKASLTNFRQAPRKVRVVADTLRGKNVQQALNDLSVLPKKAALPMTKLVQSAVANARQTDAGITERDLEVATITVDKGTTFVRFMPRAFGRAAPVNRENSHVKLVLRKVAERTGTKRGTVPAPEAETLSDGKEQATKEDGVKKPVRKAAKPRTAKKTDEETSQ